MNTDKRTIENRIPKQYYIIKNKNISLKEFGLILDNKLQVQLGSDCNERLQASEKFLSSLLKRKVLLYGINTGYGPLATTHIPLSDAKELQKNLIYHLATGVGELLSKIHVKALMLARIICLSKGYSAISLNSFQTLLDFFNLGILPVIPRLGTVGASGDLTPLAHMTLALMGESDVIYGGKRKSAKIIIKNCKLKPLDLGPKDGLALVNGTSVMTGISAVNGILSQRALDIAISLSLLFAEIMEAKEEAFQPVIGEVKPHTGIKEVLRIFKERARGSSRFHKKKQMNLATKISYENELLQDAYSIRCIPQILGAVLDVIESHNNTVTIELNSVTDNPIFVLPEEIVLHGGNFQGHSIALAADNLYNAITNLAIHSERKIARVTDSKLNNDLPPFLQGDKRGLQSGFMGAQVTATAVLAWIKSNATPSSIQSISTNANNQDVVSMGTIAALKTSECIDRVFDILAIEALVMAQAFELKNGFAHSNGFSKNSIRIVTQIRKISPFLSKDRSLSNEIQVLSNVLKEGLES
jgi:tyrosine ammonia-lyase